MNWNSLLQKGLLRGGICILLSVAIVLGLVLPGTNMEAAQPEDPLGEESIREITVLKVGDNLNNMETIVIPSGGSAAPTEPNETNPDETNPEETKPQEEIPRETEMEQPDVDNGQDGNEDGNQGEDGGDELDLDLAAVMIWYKYGNDPKTLVCGPGNSVSKTMNTAHLVNNTLKYEFQLKGEDEKYVQITSVSVAEGDSAFRQIAEDGNIQINLPGGTGDRRYTFLVTAMAEKENDAGERIEQEVTFTFVLKCEFAIDLEMELTWEEQDGGSNTVRCGPDKATAFSVQSNEIQERQLRYSTKLTGSLADNAVIVDAVYTTASGQESGSLDKNGGTLTLLPAPGTHTETYYLTFTVRTAERTVLYTYNVVYREELDVNLVFTWRDRGMISHELICQPEGSVSDRIKNNQLSAGTVAYGMELRGKEGEKGEIMSVSYVSETDIGSLETSGAIPMTMPNGASTNTYRITVTAMVSGQWMKFEVVLHYANDVTLQMEYSVLDNGSSAERIVACENGKIRTTEPIYNDQLADNELFYRMTIVGADGNDLTILSVHCFQSGTGRSISVDPSGKIELSMKKDKHDDQKFTTGENTFTVLAQDESRNEYHFTINIPYKPRGQENIKIETNLKDGQTIPNGTKTNLAVKAWSEDDSGNVLNYIPANGTDTKLTVKLDGEELSYISTSGANSEYDLIPENPEIGDTNVHILDIYAEDAQGNYGKLKLELKGIRTEAGQKVGTATIQVDMSVLGLGIVDSISYEVLSDEPVSYVIAKALLGEDTGEPFGKAKDTFGWNGSYAGTLDIGFYLQSVTTGHSAQALEGSSWPGGSEEDVLQAIDSRFGKGTGLATLWRCLYRNGLNKSSGSGGTFGEFDYTSGSGWMYSIGGTTYYPGQSMSSVYLKDGDMLTVRYTLAYGWDVGSGSPGYGSTIGYCVYALNGSFYINHQMETFTDGNGAERHICRCCGLVQDCLHEKITYIDQQNGFHMQYCENCKSTVGDSADHIWNAEEELQEHTCNLCGATENHVWRESDRTVPDDCTTPVLVTSFCRVCKVEKEEEVPNHHEFNNQWRQDGLKQHVQICFRCEEEEMNRGDHRYLEFEESINDFYCIDCLFFHYEDVGCSGTLYEKEATCEKIVYGCHGCGLEFVREGEFEDHLFLHGSCVYCGVEDPEYSGEGEEPGNTGGNGNSGDNGDNGDNSDDGNDGDNGDDGDDGDNGNDGDNGGDGGNGNDGDNGDNGNDDNDGNDDDHDRESETPEDPDASGQTFSLFSRFVRGKTLLVILCHRLFLK